jgi:hypothetical protein
MGYKLRRLLREALGREITGLQRAVALEIADDANDDSRRSYATLEQLVVWTAAKDTNVVRNALKRLAAVGWEFRVPIGEGKDGRILYAVPGKRMTFRVPEFEGVSTATPWADRGVATDTPEEVAPALPPVPQGVAMTRPGVAPAHSEGAGALSEGAGATPFSSSPQTSFLSAAVELIRSAAIVAESEERELADWITKTRKPGSAAWWRTVATNGDLPALADAWRAAQRVDTAGTARPVADVLAQTEALLDTPLDPSLNAAVLEEFWQEREAKRRNAVAPHASTEPPTDRPLAPAPPQAMLPDPDAAYRAARRVLDAAPKGDRDGALAQAAAELRDRGIVDIKQRTIRAGELLELWHARPAIQFGDPDDGKVSV